MTRYWHVLCSGFPQTVRDVSVSNYLSSSWSWLHPYRDPSRKSSSRRTPADPRIAEMIRYESIGLLGCMIHRISSWGIWCH